MAESKPLNSRFSVLRHPQSPICLVEFSNGSLKAKARVQYELYKGGVIHGKSKRILVATTEHLVYSGSNYERESFEITQSILKLAILNKRTNRMKLYDIDYFVLKPILTCVLPDIVKQTDRAEKNQALTMEFGSKFKQKAINSRLKYQAAGSDLISDSILNKNLETLPAVESVPEATSNSIIPPQNKDAKNVVEIYNVFDIISLEEYSALDSFVQHFKSASYEDIMTWKSESRYSPVIIHYLEMNCQVLTHDNAKLLCYLHYIICFLKTNYKDWRRKDPVPDVPSPIKAKMISKYTLNKSLPQRMKDKLLADALVLSLIINHFNIFATNLAASTKISIKKIVDIAYALGCHVHSSKNGDSKKIELKLPLYKYEASGWRKK